MKRKVFRSRISVWIIIPFLYIFVILVTRLIKAYQDGMISENVFIFGVLGATVMIFSFFLFLFFGLRYSISGTVLYLKTWFISIGTVKIDDIISVERSYFTTPYPMASFLYFVAPSASLKFLYIHYDVSHRNNRSNWYKPDFWLISPVREQEFIEELKAINPNIYINVPIKKGVWRFWEWDI